MQDKAFENLKKALELHSQVLHAESQAISAKDLSTVEEILQRKDESLEFLVTAKDFFEQNSSTNSDLEKLIQDVLSHQEKNTENFRKLHIQEENSSNKNRLSNSLSDRVSRAYRR